MPAMLRIKGKSTKIAHNILGIPANLKSKKTAKQEKIERRLLFEDTIRAR